ncbi:hypothetical protein [Oceanispirochaeta sp.]|uniref:hypothetical protein n=1 Tax=Oceanispirochaeta sp. TaxID=2035350 RepID=UPI00260E6B92|nr:hypothetical protein [Oceanispirochaeta sp.]MDA3958312.1 hypothetical protein [Oceanispirochaeta sp.]
MKIIILIFITSSLLLAVGCGKISQAKNVLKTAKTMAETGSKIKENDSSESQSEILDLTEKDVRDFYTAVSILNKKYPDIEFESPVTAALSAMSEGLNLERIVDQETDITFTRYNQLSTAILLVETESMGSNFAMEMISSMEESLAEYESLDKSEMSGEEKEAMDTAMDNMRADLAQAKTEAESAEMQNLYETALMVDSIRGEMGL